MGGTWQIGDALALSRELADASVDCIVTSPPYWGLRSYLADDDPGKALEMGAEPTLGEYVERLVVLFRELRRALKPGGTCWLNLGDCYHNVRTWKGGGQIGHAFHGRKMHGQPEAASGGRAANRATRQDGLKEKDLCLMPYRVAMALQADGWYLRSHVIWAKLNPMPESVTDRPTSAHEAVFLLTKSARYWYDADAVREAYADDRKGQPGNYTPHKREGAGRTDGTCAPKPGGIGRNLRNVWHLATQPYSGSHYAVMPPALVVPCIKAGCPAGGLVLDPFGGSGTVGEVAESLGRRWLLFDLDARNEALMHKRTAQRSLLGCIR